MIEETVFSFGGGALVGFLAGYAFKKLLKLAAIIIGCFILALAYLSYRGWITTNWSQVENQTRDFAMNATQQATNMINQAATHFHQVQMTPVIAGTGFIIGFGVGITRK